MWSSTVGLVNGKHRYLTAETFGFKVNSNGQQLKRRQQWTIEPFPENTGPDGSISSAASVSSTAQYGPAFGSANGNGVLPQMPQLPEDPSNASTCIMTLSNGPSGGGSLSLRHSNNGSNNGSDYSETFCDEEHENVAIKSHMNKYLAVDSFGNVTCDSDEKTENARFTITICSMSQGKSKEEHIFWAFKNVERGYYLGTTEDGMICCNAKMPQSRAELWHLHLLPARGASFFALKSLGRKRFARVCNDGTVAALPGESLAAVRTTESQVQLDANISWGPETLFQFKYYDGGRYAFLTSDNQFLTNKGKCVVSPQTDESLVPPIECLFTLEYHSGYLAFRDSFGHYLAATGRSSILRSRSIGVSRDELFMFEGVPIQVSMKATFNNRWVSIKQGVDVSANQMETTSKTETFQLTYHKQTQLWSIMTQECNFWTISKNTSTVCVCRPADYEALTRGQFKLLWSDNDATFSLKYVDHAVAPQSQSERWILARKSGQLFLGTGPANQEPVKFIMRFQNRRLLNLRPLEGSGFVGLKSLAGSSRQLEANKTSPDSIQIEYSELPVACHNGSAAAAAVGQLEAPPAGRCADGDPAEDSNSKVISMFNVKLNSTRRGQTILADLMSPSQQTAKSNQTENGDNEQEQAGDQKQLDCLLDSNNNERPEEVTKEESNGGVECAAAPSVASIINTFSSVKVSHQQQQAQTSRLAAAPTATTGSAVSKLASSFESNTIQQVETSDLTPASSLNDSSSVISSNASSQLSAGVAVAFNSGSILSDQVAQSECCYLKVVANGNYLVVGPSSGMSAGETGSGATLAASNGLGANQSVLCDATNKACAQSWILELRTHNSVAIRASDTQAYMQLGTNGTIYMSRCEPKQASLWEF